MKRKKNEIKKTKRFIRSGYISVYILIATSVAVTLLTGLVVFVSSAQKRSFNEVSRNQALEIAESGIYYYKWYLAHNLDGKNVQQIKDFWQGSPIGVDEVYEAVVEDSYGQGLGVYQIEVDPPDPDSTIVMVTATGWTYRHPEITKSIKVRFRRPSWSEYSVLANDVMRFGEGTSVYGPIHSNNGIRFDGVANNIVTSSVDEYYDPDTHSDKPGVWTSQADESQVFLAGKDFPVPAIDFNGVTADLVLMRDEAQSDGLYFGDETYEKENCRWRAGWAHCGWSFWCWSCEEEEIFIEGYHLKLRTDDKVEVRRVLDYDASDSWGAGTYQINEESEIEVFDIPENGLIFCSKPVWVDGQINTAKVTIVAADLDTSADLDIYINNDIKYTNKDGRDVIGLIAEKNISVGLYSEDNLEIDAALLAQKGRVGRDHYSSTSYRWRNEITVYGSIATNERYGFAWTDGTGYQIRNLYFDNNLLYYPPPYFPTGNVYELDLWEDL